MSQPQKVVQWGICGSGLIASDFATCLAVTGGAKLQAVAASATDKARAFAERFGIPSFYGSYEELANDPEVDIVYVSTLNPAHCAHASLFLRAKKHVLIEKPAAVALHEVEKLVALAKEHGVFLMEGFWTRFFPAARRIRQLLSAGAIGAIKQVFVDFGSVSGRTRTNDLAQGGGGLLDLGCYCVQWALLAFGGREPAKVVAAGSTNRTGADTMGSALLQFETETDVATGQVVRGGGMAVVSWSLESMSANQLVIVGDAGRITVKERMHAPTEFVLSRKPGVSAEAGGLAEEERYAFPLPSEPVGRFNYRNASGMLYEAQEVTRLVAGGARESPEYAWGEMVGVARVMQQIRDQIGVRYPNDLA